jgi:hypothetical protein
VELFAVYRSEEDSVAFAASFNRNRIHRASVTPARAKAHQFVLDRADDLVCLHGTYCSSARSFGQAEANSTGWPVSMTGSMMKNHLALTTEF